MIGDLVTVVVWFGVAVVVVVVLAVVVAVQSTGAPPRRGSTGAAILRTRRHVLDARAIARGPGAYGRRVGRRAVFRAIRRW